VRAAIGKIDGELADSRADRDERVRSSGEQSDHESPLSFHLRLRSERRLADAALREATTGPLAQLEELKRNFARLNQEYNNLSPDSGYVFMPVGSEPPMRLCRTDADGLASLVVDDSVAWVIWAQKTVPGEIWEWVLDPIEEGKTQRNGIVELGRENTLTKRGMPKGL
jgi:hypothetical protein